MLSFNTRARPLVALRRPNFAPDFGIWGTFCGSSETSRVRIRVCLFTGPLDRLALPRWCVHWGAKRGGVAHPRAPGLHFECAVPAPNRVQGVEMRGTAWPLPHHRFVRVWRKSPYLSLPFLQVRYFTWEQLSASGRIRNRPRAAAAPPRLADRAGPPPSERANALPPPRGAPPRRRRQREPLPRCVAFVSALRAQTGAPGWSGATARAHPLEVGRVGRREV